MIRTSIQNSYQFDVRCPKCNRKLMVFNISKDCEVKVNLFDVLNQKHIQQKHAVTYANPLWQLIFKLNRHLT